MMNVAVEIQVATEDDGHYVVMLVDGEESDRWGPWSDRDYAILYAKQAATLAHKTADTANKGTV